MGNNIKAGSWGQGARGWGLVVGGVNMEAELHRRGSTHYQKHLKRFRIVARMT
jgi:hypothetical protein